MKKLIYFELRKIFSKRLSMVTLIGIFYLLPANMLKHLSLLISPVGRCSNIKSCWHLPVPSALQELHC